METKPLDPISEMQAQEAERRIAAEMLHNGLCMDLTNLFFAIEIAERTLDTKPEDGKEALHAVLDAAISCNSTARFAQRRQRRTVGMLSAGVGHS